MSYLPSKIHGARSQQSHFFLRIGLFSCFDEISHVRIKIKLSLGVLPFSVLNV